MVLFEQSARSNFSASQKFVWYHGDIAFSTFPVGTNVAAFYGALHTDVKHSDNN